MQTNVHKFVGILGALSIGVLPLSTIHAAEWTKGASVALGSYYSDNICLQPDDKEGKAVGTVTPSVNLRGEGARARASLSGSVEYNTLAESSLTCSGRGQNFNNREAFVPRLSALGELEAIENWLVFDASAQASQNAINPFAAGGDDNLNGVGNTNVTYRWGVGATIDRRLSEVWRLLLGYNYNEQYNSVSRALGDSQEDRVVFDFGMNPATSRFSAGLAGRYSEVTFDGSTGQEPFVNKLSSVELRTALQVSDSWQLNALAGQEDNVFLSNVPEIDGNYWDAGVRWAPNSRVEVTAGYGERFFGETPRFSISYRHKRSSLRASYDRDLQFPRNIRAADGGLDPGDPLVPDVDLPGDPVGGAGDPTFIGQTPVLNERFTLNYRFNARRTTISLTASDSQQTRAQDGRQGSFRNFSAAVTRSLSSGLSAFGRLSYRESEGANSDDSIDLARGFETWRGTLGLNQRLSSKTSMALAYAYIDQQSVNDFRSFVENRVTLTLRYNFR
ncbi:TIGR03016 family PEP-CTERM system-associated outer membrane protein [bacterium]|nr:TIGR03016 family PEP-CTERM system-associated outer membrane protein [bacterium]